MKKRFLLLSALCALAAGQSASAAAILRITEVMSNGDATDWFELTNLGDTSASLTGYRMDDSSFAIGSSVLLNVVASINPGESVIFIENANDTAIASFRSTWNLTAAVQVGRYNGSGVGLSSDGDSVVIYNGSSAEVTRVSFGVATPGTSFTYTYDAAGNLLSGPALSPGSATLNGTPGVVPEPSSMLLGGLGMLALFRRKRA